MSGCGKTTVPLAVMAALRQRGLSVAPFKVGPDYIDPGFHRLACGHPSDNLDAHLTDAATFRAVLCAGEERSDIAVIEGVMGYYDGHEFRRFCLLPLAHGGGHPNERGPRGGRVGRRGQRGGHGAGVPALSAEQPIAGVLVNRVSSRAHYDLVRAAVERYALLPCLGYLQRTRPSPSPAGTWWCPPEKRPKLRARSSAPRAWRGRRWTWTR
jgi:cobyrinic acid a,c-diamide synthase